VVEVAPAANAALDAAVLAPNGVVSVYAADGGGEIDLSTGGLMFRNIRYQFVLVYTVPPAAKDRAVADVTAAAGDGALPVGDEAVVHELRDQRRDAVVAEAARMDRRGDEVMPKRVHRDERRQAARVAEVVRVQAARQRGASLRLAREHVELAPGDLLSQKREG